MVSDLMKRLLDTQKHKTVVLGPLQRMLLGGDEFAGTRRHDVIHPSEIVKPDFCDLALFYRLMGWEIPPEQHGFQLEVIFSQGHGYHDKWQGWVWDLGTLNVPVVGLRGRFRCLRCGHGDWEEGNETWTAVSPVACENCGALRKCLQYGEVPVKLKKYGIRGHSDGDLVLGGPEEADPLLEVKSIGEGTVRFEAPNLIKKHTHSVTMDDEEKTKRWTDWNALWRDIRRPFQTHLKQGAIYCLAKNRTEMVYIYEFKPTGAVKEFTVKHDFDLIEEELETALDVLYAVKKNKPPDCPHGGCKLCEAYEKLRDGAHDDEVGEEEDESEDREDPRAGEGEGEAEAGRNLVAAGARRRPVGGARGTRRPVRRGSHGGASREDRVGELPEREDGRGRARRGDRGDDPRSAEVSRHARAGGGAAEGDERDRAEGTRRVVRRRPRGG